MKHLVLLGAGHAHVQVLARRADLTRQGVLPPQITLITPYPRQLYSGMVPGFVAGHYTLPACTIALEPLLAGSAVRHLSQAVVALDAAAGTVTLDDGRDIGFDLLSVNTGAVQDRQQLEAALPGVREHGLFVRPIEAFGALWPRVVERAQGLALRLAVVGGGAAGIELAMAARHRLPGASVTLLAGASGAAANYPDRVRQQVARALQQRGITVLARDAAGFGPGEIHLAGGGRLACDVPLIATGAQAPAWLRSSGLALDAQGFLAVDACLRSTSHPQVFAAGDVSSRSDRQLPRSGVYAVRAGAALLKNLSAVLSGQPPAPHQPPRHTLNLLSCGDGEAILSWGTWSASGRWAWWLKDRIDRGFVRRYRGPRPP
ncbi:MAG: pyridine nucleotide-disulfide oxidoreductase [Rhodoferax sp.]|nr:pyridine nucleotide-disulfide oxidoreductase [Rhodoferax sp.]